MDYSNSRKAIPATVVAWLVIVFLVAPLFVVVPFSFTSERYLSMPEGHLSLRHYDALLHDAVWLKAIGQSVSIGLCATILAVVVGASAAIGAWHFKGWVGRIVSLLALLPLIVPAVVTAMALSRTWVTLDLFDTFTGTILAHSIIGTPFVFMTVSAALEGLDVRLVQAARSLGSSTLQALVDVVLPNLTVGVASGAAFAFFTSWDEIVVTQFLTSRNVFTLPKKIFSDIRENIDPTVTAAASVLILLTVLFAIYFLVKGNREASVKETL